MLYLKILSAYKGFGGVSLYSYAIYVGLELSHAVVEYKFVSRYSFEAISCIAMSVIDNW